MAGVSKTAILRECSIIQYLVIFWKYVHWIWMWGYKTDHNFKIFNLNSIKNKHYFQLTSHGVISILMLSWKEGHIRRLTEYIEMEFSSHIIIWLDQFQINGNIKKNLSLKKHCLPPCKNLFLRSTKNLYNRHFESRHYNMRQSEVLLNRLVSLNTK